MISASESFVESCWDLLRSEAFTAQNRLRKPTIIKSNLRVTFVLPIVQSRNRPPRIFSRTSKKCEKRLCLGKGYGVPGETSEIYVSHAFDPMPRAENSRRPTIPVRQGMKMLPHRCTLSLLTKEQLQLRCVL